MKQYFIFFDIDGTLFDHDTHTFPQSALDAIDKAKKNGHKIFLSSGRSYSDIDEVIKQLPVDGMVLGCGGQIIIDNQMVHCQTMPKSTVKELVDYFMDNQVGFALEGKDKILLYGKAFEMYRIWLSYLNEYKLMSDDELLELLAKRNTFPYTSKDEDELGNILKLSFFTKNKEIVDKYIEHMPEELFAYYDNMNPEMHTGEFYMKNVNKATGMDVVLKYFNHPLSHTIALGDSLNDKEMIEHASIGVAMGNACEDLKEIADYITKNIGDDGFEFALKHYEII